MLDHLAILVRDLARSKVFYASALAPLGYSILMEVPAELTGGSDAVGLGVAPKPDFWLSVSAHPQPTHIAFRAETRAQVDAFYRAALAAGGRDHGPPGIRAHYHANYYGAFVLDPDGYNIEAVCHAAA